MTGPRMLSHIRRGAALLALPLGLLVPTLACADVTVHGAVSDQQTHQPIAHASVMVEGTTVGTATDEGGQFTLTSPADFSNLVVSRVGYASKVVPVPDKNHPLAIELVATQVQMRPVEVTGRAVTRENLTNAQSVGELSQQDLDRGSGLTLENSINAIPGVFMQSRTAWGGAHLNIRGYYPNFSQNSNGLGYQMYIDHVPVTDASGLTIMDDIDYASLGSVEVIKGPASSRYGSAIAGTVNFLTQRPRPGESNVEVEGVSGSDDLFRDITTVNSATADASIVASYGHQWYTGFRPDDISKKDFARFSGEFHAGPKHDLLTYFAYAKSFEQLAGEIDSADFVNRQAIANPVYAANGSHIEIQSARVGATDDYRISDDFRNETTVFTTVQTMGQPFAHGFTNTNRFSFGARTAFDWSGKAGSATLHGTVGGQFQRTNYTANGFFIPRSSPSDQEDYAANYFGYTEWAAEFPAQVILTAGGALAGNQFGIRNLLKNNVITDTTALYQRTFDAKFTPRVSLLKGFGDQASVYASVSSGYTPPSLSNITNSDNTINTSLKPESATQYELGSKGNLADRRLSYQVALFDLENTDKLVSQKIGAVSTTVNVGKQRNKGAEIGLSYQAIDDPTRSLSLLRPWLSYTYSDFTYVDFKSDNNNNSATLDFSGNAVARVPKNMLNLGVDAGTNFGLSVFASYQFVDKAYITFDNLHSVGSYSLLSAKAEYQRRVAEHVNLDLSLGGDNLLGSTYYTFLFVGPTIGGLAWAKDGGTGDGYILPGSYSATLYGSVRLGYDF